MLGYVDTTSGGPADPVEPLSEPWALVVAHDGILRLVLMELLEISLDHYWALPFGLCAVTVVEIRSGRARLRAHNLSDHLPGLRSDAQGHSGPTPRRNSRRSSLRRAPRYASRSGRTSDPLPSLAE